MNIYSGVTQFAIPEKTVVTFGKFDGIHMGHMTLINAAAKIAKDNGLKLAIFTFDILPSVSFGKFEATQITTSAEKRAMFNEAGVDYLIEYPFNEETSSMSPETFISKVIHETLNAAYVVVGADWHFGKDRAGDCTTLLGYRKLYEYEVHVIEKEIFNQREISSTWIRQEIREGNMENVNILLGYPYMIMDTVKKGAHLGAQMGFATVNLYPGKEKLLPPNGVYASKIFVDGKGYYGITNIGTRPTISDENNEISVETHIFDFNQDIYDKQITVELYHFERPEIKFDTIDKLIAQVEADIEFTKTFFMINS